ncbi:MAG: ABC transporter substrate-binding protein [Kangiellaceae bacterium]|nr:ABC transporter substrate-binding protein [Kangiellaceae bacterium]
MKLTRLFKRCIEFKLAITLTFLLACNTSVDDEVVEVTPEQIRIGILAPITGPLAGFGLDMVSTARLAAYEINQAGGVNGREIGFLVRDTRLGRTGSTEASMQMTEELITEGVVGIIGPAGSGTTLSISPIVVSSDTPVISPSATSPALSSLEDNDLIWRTVASDAFQGVFLAEKLIADGNQSISIIYRDDAYGSGLQNSVSQRFEELGGQVLTIVSYPESKTDEFGGAVSDVFANGTPDAIIVISFIIDGANIMVSLANSGIPSLPKLYGVDGNKRQELLDNSPRQVLLGMRGSSPTAPSSSPNYVSFREAYLESFDKEPPVFTESTYDAVYLVALSMSVAGNNSSSGIKNNLRELSKASSDAAITINVGPQGYSLALANLSQDLDFEGAAGSVGFDQNGDVTSGNYIFWEIVEKDGELIFETLSEQSFP